MRRLAGIVLLFLLSLCAHAQQPDTSVFTFPLQLDSFVVKSGFDINAFIRRVQTDTTFYKSFRSMRVVNYTATNDIKVYDKGNKIAASLTGTTQQVIKNKCRSMKVITQSTTGDFYKRNGDYNYYTAELYDYLFFTKGNVCNENDVVGNTMNVKGKGQMEKNKYQLKQLIFNPGAKISGVPFMGDRASIFDLGEAAKYNFKVSSQTYDGQDCYVFEIKPKQGMEHSVVYNGLTTWFRKSDYTILARDYSLSYSTLFYDFDVRMKVRTIQVGKKLLPARIEYNGNWHVFSKKRERVNFTMVAAYY